MTILKVIGYGILYFIGIIIFAVIVVFATLIPYFSLQMLLFGKGDYLLFVSSTLNMIPVIMIVILIIYALIRVKEKLSMRKEKLQEKIEEGDEPVDIEKLGKPEKFFFKIINNIIKNESKIVKMFMVIKICFISVLIVAVYCGMTSYAILYNDRIKISSPITPTGVIYKYNDVKSIDVGVKKEGRNSYSPYYKVIFTDGKSVDLFGGSSLDDKDKGFENILVDFDNKLRAEGVSKSINKANFEKYSKGLDKNFISRVEKLFDDK